MNDTGLSEIERIVSEYFNGDTLKVTMWMSTPNDRLSGLSPNQLIERGNVDKLLNILQEETK